MSERWQINRVSTPERIFDKIRNEMAQPVGVLIFGADCDFKNEIANELIANFAGAKTILDDTPSTKQIVDFIHSKQSVMVAIFDAWSSASHDLRHECVKVMQRAGFETVIGVYVRCAKLEPLPARGFMRKSRRAEVNQQIEVLEKAPPTPDGLDYLIVVDE